MQRSDSLQIPSLSTPTLPTTHFVPKELLHSNLGLSSTSIPFEKVDLESASEPESRERWLTLLRASSFFHGTQDANMLPHNWATSQDPGEALYGKPIWTQARLLAPNNLQDQVTRADELANQMLGEIQSDLKQYIASREPFPNVGRSQWDPFCASFMTALTLSLLTSLISSWVGKQIFQVTQQDLGTFAIQMTVETAALTAIFYGCVCRCVSIPSMEHPMEVRLKEHAYTWCKDDSIVQRGPENGSLTVHRDNLFSAIRKLDPHAPLLTIEEI